MQCSYMGAFSLLAAAMSAVSAVHSKQPNNHHGGVPHASHSPDGPTSIIPRPLFVLLIKVIS